MSFNDKQKKLGDIKDALVDTKIWGQSNKKADDLTEDLQTAHENMMNDEAMNQLSGQADVGPGILPYKKKEDEEMGGSGGRM